MRAVIFGEDGRRRWATDDGAHLLGIQRGECFIYPDETLEFHGGGPLIIHHAILLSRGIDLVRNTLELHVKHDDGLTAP